MIAGYITPSRSPSRSRWHDHCNMDEPLHVVVNRVKGCSVWLSWFRLVTFQKISKLHVTYIPDLKQVLWLIGCIWDFCTSKLITSLIYLICISDVFGNCRNVFLKMVDMVWLWLCSYRPGLSNWRGSWIRFMKRCLWETQRWRSPELIGSTLPETKSSCPWN